MDKINWLRQNIGIIRIPEVSALLDMLAAGATAALRPVSQVPHMSIPLSDVWAEFFRQMKSHMKTPRGGLAGGGSQQTTFEMPMVTKEGAEAMFGTWPKKLGETDPCWELKTMTECDSYLAFQDSHTARAWGLGNCRPLSVGGGAASCLLLAAPPFTVRLRRTTEGLPILQVNWPLVIFSESGAVILPPDSEDPMIARATIPFYTDPVNQPGLHRDVFAAHSRKLIGRLLKSDFRLSPALKGQAPQEILDQLTAQAAAQAATQQQAEAAQQQTEEAQQLEEMGMEVVTAIRGERSAKHQRRGGVRREFLVEWAGYRPEWEGEYRQGRGAVGTPFTTWEAEKTVKKLEAFKAWRTMHPTPTDAFPFELTRLATSRSRAGSTPSS